MPSYPTKYPVKTTFLGTNGEGARAVAHGFVSGLDKCRHTKGKPRPHHSRACDVLTKLIHSAWGGGWHSHYLHIGGQ